MNVSNHAVQRFKERSNIKLKKKEIKHYILFLLDHSHVARFRKKGELFRRLLKYGMEGVHYYLSDNGWLIVVKDKTILTIFRNRKRMTKVKMLK